MADEPNTSGSAATYSQEQLTAAIEEKIAGLKANRDEVLKEAKAAKERLKAFEGVDPDEHKRLKLEAEALVVKKATAEGDFKALEKQLIDRHAAEVAGRDTKIAKMQKAIEQRLVQAELRKAIGEKGGLADMADLLLEYGARNVRVKETDDGFEAYVVDGAGNPMIADGKGTPMDIAGFVESTLMQKYPRAFAGTGSSGSGAAKSNAGGGGAKVIAAGDNNAFLANLKGIADGSVRVQS